LSILKRGYTHIVKACRWTTWYANLIYGMGIHARVPSQTGL
jgi:hypothetical protein